MAFFNKMQERQINEEVDNIEADAEALHRFPAEVSTTPCVVLKLKISWED